MIRESDFTSKTIEALAKRASYICSNPDCRCLTLAPSGEDMTKSIYIGKGAHITAASEGGARYDGTLSVDQRKDISNGIFLCSNCADMVDKNNGIDFSVDTLNKWKSSHEKWVRENLNKSVENNLVVIDGQHHAKGMGEITGLHIKQRSAIIKPGTIVTADGVGNVTGTKIE
mgnify:CR=1 FL=1